MTVITAETADVRAGPSTDQPVVGRVRQSDVVFVMENRGDWVRIEFSVSGDEWASGWLAGQHVRSRGRVSESEAAFGTAIVDVRQNENGASYTLRLRDATVGCRKDVDAGFNNCDVDFQVAAETTYNGERNPRIRYSCAANLVATDINGGRADTAVSGIAEVYAQGGDDQLSVNVNLYPTARNVAVRLTDVTCAIRDVAE
ncbi:MAG: SH3 domain-containing protein [Rhodospirillales bacterium]